MSVADDQLDRLCNNGRRIMNNELVIQKAVWPIYKDYHCISLDILKKIMENQLVPKLMSTRIYLHL
jgi:hypothetical protein